MLRFLIYFTIKGLCTLNNDVTNTILASPDKKTGHVLVHLYGRA